MKLTVFGEILWDLFDDDKKIGGAPFNFGAHCAKLGHDVHVVSAVGDDELGLLAVNEAEKLNVNTDNILVVPFKTGRCIVTLNNGTPSYNLVKDVAYDNIPLPDKSCFTADAFYFGTLAQRSENSQNTLKELLKGNYREVFFDINIRQNYFSDEMIDTSLKATTIFKISREEIGVLKIDGTNEEICKKLKEKYPNLKLIIVTLDCDGAFVYDAKNDKFYYSKKPNVKVVSTVGAGDSFSACFLSNFLAGVDIEECLNRASLLSEYVVTQLGAIPDYPAKLQKKILP